MIATVSGGDAKTSRIGWRRRIAIMTLAALLCALALLFIINRIDQTRQQLSRESPNSTHYLLQVSHHLNTLLMQLSTYRTAVSEGSESANLQRQYQRRFEILWSAFQIYELRFPGIDSKDVHIHDTKNRFREFLHYHEAVISNNAVPDPLMIDEFVAQAGEHRKALHQNGIQYLHRAAVAQQISMQQIDKLYYYFWIFGAALLLASVLLLRLLLQAKKQALVYQARQWKTKQKMETVVEELHSDKKTSAAKDSLFAAANHDLRQPLQAMTLLISSLQPDVTSTQGKESLQALEKCSFNLNELLHSLLDLSQLDAGRMKTNLTHFDLQQVVKNVRHEVALTANNAGIQLQFQSTSSIVKSDQLLLSRIVRNLANNAIRHSQAAVVKISCHTDGEYATITVQDDGIGIPKAECDRIFGEFYQVVNPNRDKSRGLGLGLAIVKRLSDLLGVEIRLESTEETGTRFRLQLPCVQNNPAQSDLAHQTKDVPGHGELIAVIDDEPYIRLGMKAMLRTWSFEAEIAASADELMQQLKKRDQAPDVLIADYHLAQFATGDDAIQQLRRQYGEQLPAMLITGENTGDLTKLQTRDTPVLKKPIEPGELRALLDTLLSKRTARPALPPAFISQAEPLQVL